MGTRVPAPGRVTGGPATIPSARALLAKAADENFAVAPWFVGPRLRRELNSLYGFARLVDDLGDEAAGDRLSLLDWAEAELERAAAAAAPHPVFAALAPTIRRHDLDLGPFRDLIEANRIDQRVTRCATFADLLGYCERSANPVGRVVLAILGASTPERGRWSDQVCSALQVVEHLQDVGEDMTRGRVYLPADDLSASGCSLEDLVAATASTALRGVVAAQAARADHLLAAAIPLTASLRGRARLLIAGFAAGGAAVIDALAAADHDVLRVDVRAKKADVVRHTGRILRAAHRVRRAGRGE